jgi:hypothetical protein
VGIDVECVTGNFQSRVNNQTSEGDPRGINYPKSDNDNDDTLTLFRPNVSFDFVDSKDSAIKISFHQFQSAEVLLLYYPGALDASELGENGSQDDINCQIVTSANVLIVNLEPATVYTFCALIRNQVIMTPFQCKSYQTATPFPRQTWLYQEQKWLLLTLFMLVVLVAALTGIIATYLLIRRIPTLMRGSKRVVMVNNSTKDVMVLTSGSRSSSWQRDVSSPIKEEAPAYMTPCPPPRQSFDK